MRILLAGEVNLRLQFAGTRESGGENLASVRIPETGTDVTLLAIKDDFL